MPFILIFLVFFILALVIGWHIIFALLGGAIVVTTGVWTMAVIGIVVFCIAILITFFLTGLAGILLGVFFAIWTVVAVIAFPILFPILLPLFIIYAFISMMRRKKKDKAQ